MGIFRDRFEQPQQFYEQLNPQQLGDMHDYAERQNPSILHRVMNHPVLDAALVALGVHEWKKHEER